MFITFEGIDGAGKSTQARRLDSVLRTKNHAVCLTREPGGTHLAERVRDLVVTPPTNPIIVDAAAQEQWSAEAALLLMNAARAQHVVAINAMLKDNIIVICDRFTDSTMAYQHGGQGLERSWVLTTNHIATGGLTPDLTFLLDLDPADLPARLRERGALNHLDHHPPAFYERVRLAFLVEAKLAPQRVVVIDATLPQAVIADHILQTTLQRLEQHG